MLPLQNTLKPMRLRIKKAKPETAPEQQQQEKLPFEPPALGRHAYTRPRSFARTHARHEHETKPTPISRLGSAEASFPSISDI